MKAILRRAVILAFVALFLLQLILLLTIDRFGRSDQAQAANLIIVLGAGLQADGQPTANMIARAEHGAALYHRGLAGRVLCSGGFTRISYESEAATCAAILQAAGVPRPVILLEERSESTEENAIQAAQLMRENDWQSAVVVSNSYHLWRAHWLFAEYGIPVWTSPVPGGYLTPSKYAQSLAREVLAVNWQYLVNALDLPWTDFPP